MIHTRLTDFVLFHFQALQNGLELLHWLGTIDSTTKPKVRDSILNNELSWSPMLFLNRPTFCIHKWIFEINPHSLFSQQEINTLPYIHYLTIHYLTLFYIAIILSFQMPPSVMRQQIQRSTQASYTASWVLPNKESCSNCSNTHHNIYFLDGTTWVQCHTLDNNR